MRSCMFNTIGTYLFKSPNLFISRRRAGAIKEKSKVWKLLTVLDLVGALLSVMNMKRLRM